MEDIYQARLTGQRPWSRPSTLLRDDLTVDFGITGNPLGGDGEGKAEGNEFSNVKEKVFLQCKCLI